MKNYQLEEDQDKIVEMFTAADLDLDNLLSNGEFYEFFSQESYAKITRQNAIEIVKNIYQFEFEWWI